MRIIIQTISFLSLLLLTQSCEEASSEEEQKSINKTNWSIDNDTYHLKVLVPNDWILYGQFDDTINKKLIVDWELPSVYSELEKQDINNSISITAIKNVESLDALILGHYVGIDQTNTALETNSSNDSRTIHFEQNGLKYKGKSYYRFRNGIGYMIVFMATPGTYVKNIKLFEDFQSKVVIN